MSKAIIPLIVIAALFVCSCMESGNKSDNIPENYYLDLKPADVDSPIELIRFATSIRPYTTDFTVSERVALFEWYLKNRGFNVTFAYSDNFRNSGSGKYAWWKEGSGQDILNENIMLSKKSEL